MQRVHRRGFAFWCSTGWLSLLVIAAATASWLPFDVHAFNPANGLRPPSLGHPFGTTRLGEDVFAICVHGSRLALLVGVGAALLACLLGTPLGMVAAYFGGWVDRLVAIVLDAWMAVPALVLALCLTLFLGQSLGLLVVMIGVLLAPPFARLARALTWNVVDRDFVAAARLEGARHMRILVREIGPNIAVPLCTYLFLLAGAAILIEGGLGFVGLGAPLDKASWGRLIFTGRDELERAWWWSLCPTGVFFLTIVSLNLLGDAWQAKWLGRPRSSRLRRAAPEHVVVLGALTSRAQRADAVLGVRDLRTRLHTALGTIEAVDGVSIQVGQGELVAIVGESGAGKTMLARSILGLEPAIAEVDGRVLLNGVDLRAIPARELRSHCGREIAIVLQDPGTSLNPVMRVGAQIEELLRVHRRMSRREARARAVALLTEVGIPEPRRRAWQYPHELSGGQRQRVAIAMALSGDPDLLIADEPTSALDVIVQAQVLDLLDRLRRDRRLAVVLITHDLSLATARADRVSVMYAGRIVEEATAQQIACGPRMPYAAALFAAAPRLSAPSHSRVTPVPGRARLPIAGQLGCAFADRCPRVDDRCRSAAPPLAPLDEGRLVACWHPIGG